MHLKCEGMVFAEYFGCRGWRARKLRGGGVQKRDSRDLEVTVRFEIRMMDEGLTSFRSAFVVHVRHIVMDTLQSDLRRHADPLHFGQDPSVEQSRCPFSVRLFVPQTSRRSLER